MKTKGFFDKPNMNLNAIVLPDIPIWLIDKPVIELNIFFLCRKNDNTNQGVEPFQITVRVQI